MSTPDLAHQAPDVAHDLASVSLGELYGLVAQSALSEDAISWWRSDVFLAAVSRAESKKARSEIIGNLAAHCKRNKQYVRQRIRIAQAFPPESGAREWADTPFWLYRLVSQHANAREDAEELLSLLLDEGVSTEAEARAHLKGDEPPPDPEQQYKEKLRREWRDEDRLRWAREVLGEYERTDSR